MQCRDHCTVACLCRCFTVGIGSGASTALVEGLAKAGNGIAEFVKEGEKTSMQAKVSERNNERFDRVNEEGSKV